MQLAGFEISNYRSIGEDPVIINPIKKCNILIGQNNSGKSNIIRVLPVIFGAFQQYQDNKSSLKLENRDYHQRDEKNIPSLKLYFQLGSNEENHQLKKWTNLNEYMFKFVINPSFKMVDNSFANLPLKQADVILLEQDRKSFLSHASQEAIHSEMLRISPTILRQYFPKELIKVYTIPEFRQIQSGSSYDYDGKDLIKLLAQWQAPIYGKEDERIKFVKLEKFIQELLHLRTAKLEIPHTQDVILIQNGSLRLELSSYGTGIHQLIILLTAILSIENSICCIEEPDVHLHPTLQKEFIQFLVRETTNQYFISTHSPAFINLQANISSEIASQIQIVHLRLEEGKTVGGSILEDSHSLAALADLGVKASDILQTNCVIWVEGPSDRIYLNKWLELQAADLIEGLHYSIMFYGGRLLSHMAVTREKPEDKVPEELIDILKINQNAIVMMDSDKTGKRKHLNSTKRRVEQECNQAGGYSWITEGREVENYISSNIINKALSISIQIDPYEQLGDVIDAGLKADNQKPVNYAADKVKWARKFVEYFEKDDIGDDLKKQLDKVIAKIREWNK